ncbi:MAG: tRNA pseudouridine(55) synthase TruB [Desulfuromonas sp.]|nr:MAG: tRNA pseudouridine(55) synthase TruB [Desulfuromonas sp.]
MDGILLIDKPVGITSNDVVRRVRRLLRTRRVGHTGTLDPLASGLLPVAVGFGTRLVEFLMEGEKSYRATLALGVSTDTQDSEGKVLEQRDPSGVDCDRLLAVCATLTGDQQQVPPMYSALKRDGVPLYKLARQGIEVERPPRQVRIERLELLRFDTPSAEIEVDCSKGTYIRTLCHDLGAKLGVGAHMTSLRRLRSGFLQLEQARPLDNFDPDNPPKVGEGPFLSLRQALAGWPEVRLDSEAVRRLRHGIPPMLNQVAGDPLSPHDKVLLLEGERLLAIAMFAPQREKEKRGDFELLRVFAAE